MAMNKTTRLVTTSSVLCVLAIGAFLFLFFFIRIEVDHLETLSEDVRLAEDQQDKLESLRQTVARITKDRERLDSYFLAEQDIPNFLEVIEDLGTQTNTTVTLTSVEESKWRLPNASEKDEQAVYKTLVLTITAEGAWDGVFQMVSLLETFPAPVIVHQASFDVASTESNPIKWKSTMRVSVIQK